MGEGKERAEQMKKIGVLGGSGNIGMWALRILSKDSRCHVTATGLNTCNIPPEVRERLSGVEWRDVNAEEEADLEQFAVTMDVVVNCIGPSVKYSRSIAAICLKQAAVYVDAGHIRPLHNQINPAAFCVYAAGAAPGLSALLCRYAASQYQSIERMVYINAMSGAFSRSAAWDYLDGINGRFTSDAEPAVLNSKIGSRYLPFVDGNVELFPYYDEEAHNVAKSTCAAKAEFYVALQGTLIRKAIEYAVILYGQDPERAVAELVSASKINQVTTGEYLMFLVEVTGRRKDGSSGVHTLALKSNNPSALTGQVTGAVAALAANTKMNTGICALAEIAEYENIIGSISMFAGVEQFHMYESDIMSLSAVETGEL